MSTRDRHRAGCLIKQQVLPSHRHEYFVGVWGQFGVLYTAGVHDRQEQCPSRQAMTFLPVSLSGWHAEQTNAAFNMLLDSEASQSKRSMWGALAHVHHALGQLGFSCGRVHRMQLGGHLVLELGRNQSCQEGKSSRN